MPSFAAGFDVDGALVDPLGDAALALAERRVLGVVWLDRGLRVVAMAGAVPKSVVSGALATYAFVAMIGLEDELAAMQQQGDAPPIRIPNTAVVGSDGQTQPRMNLTVFWIAQRQLYLVLMERSSRRNPRPPNSIRKFVAAD